LFVLPVLWTHTTVKQFMLLVLWTHTTIKHIPSKHAEIKITVPSHKYSFTPYPSLSPYSQTDGTKDRETKTLAACGLEELFFQLCHCVSLFLLWREIVLGVTYLPYQLCHCVWLHRSVFWLWREIVLGVTYLPTIPVVPLCQVFGCGGK
jgi:hypothetical protein